METAVVDEKKKSEEDDGQLAPFTSLFRYADCMSLLALFVGLLGCAGAGAVLPAFCFVFGDIVDEMSSPDDVSELIAPAVYGMTALGGIGFFTFFVGFYCLGWAATRIANGFRIEYLKAVLRQDAQHFDHAEPGAIALTLSDAAFDIQAGLADKCAMMLQGFFQFVFGFIFAFYFGATLTLILLAFIPPLGIITYLLTTYGAQDGILGAQAYEDAASIASETLNNMRTILSLNAECNRSKRYDGKLKKAEKAAVKQGTGLSAFAGLIFLVIFVMEGFGFWFGGKLIADSTDRALEKYPPPANFAEDEDYAYVIKESGCGNYVGAALEVCFCGLPWDTIQDNFPNVTITPPNCGCGYNDDDLLLGQSVCFTGGDTLMVFFAVLIGGFALGQIGPGVKALVTARRSASKMLAVINRYPDIDVSKTPENSKQKALAREDVTGEIKFEKVAFHYSPKENSDGSAQQPPPVFANIELTIKAGETVALVGESGCGKSTISKLVQRFYDPTSGRVLLDGVDIKDIAVRDLRANIGVVSQEPLLFDTSVLENIRYGKPDATDAEVIAAAKNANAHKFISSFPDGYNTKVGMKGGKLSGGQKQRVAIARALLRDPPILILDEATSALDNKSEKIVQKTLDGLLGKEGKSKRTTIVIAHRMSTIRNADHICVLGSPEGTSTAANGSIILEEGNHKELMSINGGFYKALVMAGGKGMDDDAVVNANEVDVLNDESGKDFELEDDDTQFTELGDSSAVSVSTESDDGEETKSAWQKMFGSKSPEEIQKIKEEKEAEKKNKNRIWKYTKPDMHWIIFGTISSAAKGTVWPLLSIAFTEVLVTWYEVDTDVMRSDSLKWSFMFYGLAVACFASEIVQKGVFEMVGERLCRRVRSDLFRSMLRQDITWFEDDKNSLGVLASNLSTDVKLLRLVTGQSIAATIETLSALTTGIIISLVASWEIFLIMLAMVPLLGMTEALNWLVLSGSESQIKTSIEGCSSTLSETVNGIREIHAFALQEKVTKDIEIKINETVVPKSKMAAISKGFMMGMIQVITFGVYAFAFWFGGKMIDQGRTTFDDFNMALFAMAFAATGLGQAAIFAGDAAKAAAAVKSVSRILDRIADIDSKPWENNGIADMDSELPVERKVSTDSLEQGEWNLKDVNFAYPTRQALRIFDQINLMIPQGKTVALVGSSGCGKSTIVQLLERFYDPAAIMTADGDMKTQLASSNVEVELSGVVGSDVEVGTEPNDKNDSGVVELDGNDLREQDIRWVRKNIGLVGQEPVLFNDTVYNNIALGKDDCTKEEVEAAAKSANAYDFIMELPDKFDTNVGIMGNKVSGGQKQRIAIARALVSQPKILLLDEATSALDNESEKIVQASLDKLLKESEGTRTTIIIAHRLSTIQNADLICVLDNDGDGSKVVEKGTHDELMALGKKYKALVEAYAK